MMCCFFPPQFGDIGNVIGILVIIFNCALHESVVPALEMVSTVNILPVFCRCPNIRVAVLAKFALSFLEFALENHDMLVLTQQDISYISSQLSEAVVQGSSTHWFSDLELLKVLANLTTNPHFSTNVIQMVVENSIPSTVAQFLQSSKLDVKKAALRLLLNFYSFFDQPSIKQIHGGKASAVEATLKTLVSTDTKDFDIQEMATCALLFLDPNLKESKYE